MDVLTAQYPALFVRKFNVKYTDFQPSGNTQASILLHSEKKRCFPFAFQIKHSTKFAGNNLSNANIYLGDAIYQSSFPDVTSPFASLDCFTDVSDTNGIQSGLPASGRLNPADSSKIMLPYDNPAEIYCCLDLLGGATMNDLTAGELDIWYCIFFLK